MTCSIRYLFALILSLHLASFVVAQEQKPSPSTPAPAESQPTNWKEFKSPAGGFSVAMPGEPKPESSPTDTELGQIEMHGFLLETDLGAYYVSYADFPKYSDEPGEVRKILDAGRDEQLAKGARLLNENDVTMPGGAVGREWLIESDGLILRNRSFFIKGRLYQALFVTTPEVAFKTGKPSSNLKDRTELYEEIGTRFQGSFKLVAPPDAPEAEVDSLLRNQRTPTPVCHEHCSCSSSDIFSDSL